VLRLWRVSGLADGNEPSLQEIRKVRIRCGIAGNLTFATDGRRVLATRQDRTLTLWDAKSFAVLEEIDRPGCRFGLPVLARNGSCMAVVNRFSEIWLWQSEIGPPSLRQRPLILTAMHPDRLALTPDGRLLLSGDSNSAVTIWDTRTGNQIWDRNDSMGIAPSLPEPPPFLEALNAGLKRSDTEIPRAIWDEEGGQHSRNVLARLDTSPSGCHFVAVNGASIHVWDLSSLSRILVHSWRSQKNWIDAVAYSPDGRLIALGDSSGEVWISRAADETPD
jgi:WD40 repeat protein